MTVSRCRLSFGLTAILCAGAACAQARNPSRQQPPDIVVILADDLGFADIGCYGSEVPTPSLDALAANGVRFTQFYNTARCCPSRASLMTGRWPHAAEMGWMTAADMGRPGYHNQLAADAPTMAELLRERGYATYMVGKWHLTHAGTQQHGPNGSWPTERGFDEWYGTMEGAKNYFRPLQLYRNETYIAPDSLPDDYFYTRALGDAALEFVGEHDGQQPMFLYMAFNAPHFPLQAPAEEIARHRGRYRTGYDAWRAQRLERQIELGILPQGTELSPRGKGIPAWDSLDRERQQHSELRMATYAAMIAVMDRQIGRVVDAQRKRGRLDDTLFLFVSDNGAEGAGGALGGGPADRIGTPQAPRNTTLGKAWAEVGNTPFRLYKTHAHEGGVRTPLVVSWPGHVDDPGSLRNHPGHLIDLLPTVLAASARPAKRGQLEGADLLPLVADKSRDRVSSPRPIFFEHESRRGLRDGNFKLVANGKKAAWELYDLARDPAETHDLAAEQPATVERLAATWQAWGERCNVLPLDGSGWNARIKRARRARKNKQR